MLPGDTWRQGGATTSRSAGVQPVIANTARLKAAMDRHELAAVVVRSGINVTYLAGLAYPGTLARHLDMTSSVRGVVAVWLRNGEPLIIVDPAAEPVTRVRSWIRRVEVFEPYVEDVYGRLAHVLEDAGLATERVGIEKDAISARHCEELQRALPRLHAVDCTGLLEEVRWVKTPGEVALLQEAAHLLDDAYAEVFPTIRAGQTERAVHSRIVASCIRRGAGWAHGILNSSANDVLYGGEGDTPFRAGDLVRTDYVAYLDGYPGHQSRMAVLGRPSEAQRREYGLTREIHLGAMARCRRGILASEIYAWVVQEYAKHGVTYTASLVGHGVGPWFHQQEPIMSRSRHVLLEEGMVLALEPYRGSWHIQDLIRVTAREPELLSAKFPTDELFVID